VPDKADSDANIFLSSLKDLGLLHNVAVNTIHIFSTPYPFPLPPWCTYGSLRRLHTYGEYPGAAQQQLHAEQLSWWPPMPNQRQESSDEYFWRLTGARVARRPAKEQYAQHIVIGRRFRVVD
jgi:hypothetical protein